jgi:hypothetical protein
MQYDSNTSLPLIEQIGLMIQVGKNVPIHPRNYIQGVIYAFGYFDKYIFITIQCKFKDKSRKDIYWSVKPLIQRNFPIGEQVFIFYDIHNVIELPGLQVFFIHDIASLPSVLP